MKISLLKICALTATVFLFSLPIKAQITLARQALSSHGILYQSPTPGIDVMTTAGESFIKTLGGGVLKLSLTQGIQQPDNIYSTGVDPVSELPFEFRAYPNPAADQLILSFEGTLNRKMKAQLFDIRGRKIPDLQAEFSYTDEKVWQISNLAEGMYMLRLMDENGRVLITEPILKR